MRRVNVLFLVGILALPTALAATPARLHVESADPVALDALVTARLPAGSARIDESVVTAEFTVRVARGHVWIDTWDSTRVPRGQLADPTVSREEHAVEDAVLRFRVDGELFAMNVQASEGGALVVHGHARGNGVPTRLARDVGSQIAPEPPARIASGGEYVRMSLAKGDAFLGNYPDPEPLVGFPLSRPSTLWLEGPARFHVHGGHVEFVDATGAPRSYRLGNWTSDASPISPVAAREVWQRLIFQGDLAGSDVPTGDWWIAGAREIEWTIDGDVRWARASGRVVTPHGTKEFRDATVHARGVADVLPIPSAVEVPTATRSYTAEGEWERLDIVGVALPAAPASPAAVTGATLGIATLLALAAWLLYSRLSRAALLDHPTRRRIHDAVAGSPGIHLRALHRAVGGAWGPFAFHVEMLARAGYLAIRREGGYKAVFPMGADQSAPGQPRSEAARAIFDALPSDGTAVELATLRASVGLSRQLVDHHLRALERQGLVALTDAPRSAQRTVAARSGVDVAKRHGDAGQPL